MERVTKILLVLSIFLAVLLTFTEGGRTISTKQDNNTAHNLDDIERLLESFPSPLSKRSPFQILEPDPDKPSKYDGDTADDTPKGPPQEDKPYKGSLSPKSRDKTKGDSLQSHGNSMEYTKTMQGEISFKDSFKDMVRDADKDPKYGKASTESEDVEKAVYFKYYVKEDEKVTGTSKENDKDGKGFP